MKRTTLEALKFRLLCARLGWPRWQVVGLLESIWLLTARDAPRGDLGRFTDDEIGMGIGWEDLPCWPWADVIGNLIATGWLDEDEDHRLLVHDWPEHADPWVHLRLARRCERFADGAAPSLSKCTRQERERARAAYAVPRAVPHADPRAVPQPALTTSEPQRGPARGPSRGPMPCPAKGMAPSAHSPTPTPSDSERPSGGESERGVVGAGRARTTGAEVAALIESLRGPQEPPDDPGEVPMGEGDPRTPDGANAAEGNQEPPAAWPACLLIARGVLQGEAQRLAQLVTPERLHSIAKRLDEGADNPTGLAISLALDHSKEEELTQIGQLEALTRNRRKRAPT